MFLLTGWFSILQSTFGLLLTGQLQSSNVNRSALFFLYKLRGQKVLRDEMSLDGV